MNDPFAALPYRPCVGVMLVNHAGHAFVGKRIDTRGQPDEGGIYWQMPQGGIDEGEDLRTAALRGSLLALTAVATRVGRDDVAAHQIAFEVWNLLAMGMDALAIAGQALTGKGLGAQDVAGVRAATRVMVRWGVVGGAVLGMLVAVSGPLVAPLFSNDPAVRVAQDHEAAPQRLFVPQGQPHPVQPNQGILPLTADAGHRRSQPPVQIGQTRALLHRHAPRIGQNPHQ